MIPIKLQIKNFLSYGPELQTIDFGSYQLICLSGKNGHGKSALLDSITWALWGEARKISGASKSDDGLVCLGQSHMMVIFDFECNKQKYRIKREYLKSVSKATANLEFGIFDPSYVKTSDGIPNECSEKLISLSEKRIRDTQKKIEDTILLTIDTFVNSAFLRQGQANEFSKKSPKERKDIFAGILGLQQYDLVKKLASDKSRLAAIERDNLEKFQEKIKLELNKKIDLEEQILNITNNLENICNQEKICIEKREKILNEQKKLTEDQKNKQILLFKENDIKTKESNEQKELIIILKEWKNIHSKKLKLKKINKNNDKNYNTNYNTKNLHEEKIELQKKIDAYQNALQEQLNLKEQYLNTKENLQKVEQNFHLNFNAQIQEKKLDVEKLNIELRNTEHTLKELLNQQNNKNTQKKNVTEDLKKLQDLISINSVNNNDLEKEEVKFEKRKNYYQQYIAQGNALKKELDALEQKHLLSDHEDNPSCPLCEQNLSASRKKFLKTKFTQQKKFNTHRLARFSKLISSLKHVLIAQNDTIKLLKTAQEKNKITQVQITELEKNLILFNSEINNINTSFADIKNTQKEICKKIDIGNKDLQKTQAQEKILLQENCDYKTLLEKTEKIITQIKNINYNEQAHKKATCELNELNTQIIELEKIKIEIDNQENRKNLISQICTELKKIKQELANIYNQIKKYENLETLQKNIDAKESEINLEQRELTKQKEILFHSKGALENQINKLKELEQEFKKEQEKIEQLTLEYQDYKIIAEASGKDGIQAFLIESAIPEVEQEANDILSKLTNNQAQIMIESLRDLKNGSTKETLDIKISDSAGIRPYELFSGGEAFRIDFALRIAISKLLARRAGTALQTLIIDEGFGSQDEEGLGKIMDAIYKIQEDFSKIIIVSHLNSMKDQFPVHFNIQKGPQGSFVKVFEQG